MALGDAARREAAQRQVAERAAELLAHGGRAGGQARRRRASSDSSRSSSTVHQNGRPWSRRSAPRRARGRRLVVGVRVGERRALHRLRGLGDRHRLVAVDLGQRVVERVDRVVPGRGSARACPSPGTAAAGTARGSRGRRARCCEIFDSWYAVASAIVAARAGIPRCTATAAMSAAFSACSGSGSTVAALHRAPCTLAGRGAGRAPRHASATQPAADADDRADGRRAPIAATRPVGRGTASQLACRAALSSMPLALPRHRLDRAR